MAGWSARTRAPRGILQLPRAVRDREILASRLEDAAHFPGGHADELMMPASEAEVAAVLDASRRVLPIGTQTSLTGGATPFGDTLLATTRLNRIIGIEDAGIRVEPGVTLAQLDEALRRADRYYPPAPTFTGATVGGTVSTCAAGAATFKYGTTRRWVKALTVVLASGNVLDLTRGDVPAHPDGYFEIESASGPIRVPVPRYHMPDVAKLSAGYYARPGMDLIDLFIGSEGTLGVVTEITLQTVAPRPAFCVALVPLPSTSRAIELAGRLRNASIDTWSEFLDARSLDLLREDAVVDSSASRGIALSPDARAALLITLELPPDTTAAAAYEQIGRAGDATDDSMKTPGPLAHFCRILGEAGVLDRTVLAVPGDTAHAAQLTTIREAVPAAVNARVGRAKRQQDAAIEKVAADIIVPFDRVEELLDIATKQFRRSGVDAAVWGHLSDGNLHPNVIPRSRADVEAGEEIVLRLGREAIRLGGAPLAEHGVGRNRIKQQLLRELYGSEGIDDMRAVKRALDPGGKLAPGVLFP